MTGPSSEQTRECDKLWNRECVDCNVPIVHPQCKVVYVGKYSNPSFGPFPQVLFRNWVFKASCAFGMCHILLVSHFHPFSSILSPLSRGYGLSTHALLCGLLSWGYRLSTHALLCGPSSWGYGLSTHALLCGPLSWGYGLKPSTSTVPCPKLGRGTGAAHGQDPTPRGGGGGGSTDPKIVV